MVDDEDGCKWVNVSCARVVLVKVPVVDVDWHVCLCAATVSRLHCHGGLNEAAVVPCSSVCSGTA